MYVREQLVVLSKASVPATAGPRPPHTPPQAIEPASSTRPAGWLAGLMSVEACRARDAHMMHAGIRRLTHAHTRHEVTGSDRHTPVTDDGTHTQRPDTRVPHSQMHTTERTCSVQRIHGQLEPLDCTHRWYTRAALVTQGVIHVRRPAVLQYCSSVAL